MLEDLIAEARERGDPWVVGRLFFLAELEVVSGEWDRAARLVTSRWRSRAKTGWDNFFPALSATSWSQIAAQRGEVERVRTETPPTLLQGCRADWHRRLRLPNWSGRWRHSSSRWRRRIRHGHTSSPFREGPGNGRVSRPGRRAVAIEALIGIGDLETPSVCSTQLEAHATESDTAARALARRCARPSCSLPEATRRGRSTRSRLRPPTPTLRRRRIRSSARARSCARFGLAPRTTQARRARLP